MKKTSIIIIVILAVISTYLLSTINKSESNKFNILKEQRHNILDSIHIRDKNNETLNKDLNKLKEKTYDTIHLNENIKTIDQKINKIKYDKENDTVNYTINDQYIKFFSEYFRGR